MTPAKLPESMIKPRRIVSEARVGETFGIFSPFSPEMLVDLDGSCYLYADARLLDAGYAGRRVTISVERREDGFHVTSHPECQWEPRALVASEKRIPVASLAVKE